MISSIVFLNFKGEILLYRAYKDDITMGEVRQYCAQKIATQQYLQNPIVYFNGASYISVPQKDLIFLATTKINVNAAMTIQFLYSLIFICKAYCEGEVNENKIQKKLSLFYQILDEVMDYGCPQITDQSILRTIITEEEFNIELLKDLKKLRPLTSIATGSQYCFYPARIVYRNNEIFVDVIENVSILFSAQGNILKSDVSGVIQINARLSGIPECKLGISGNILRQTKSSQSSKPIIDKRSSIDLKFHECVKIPKFGKEKSIVFTPPDEPFDLMSYKVTENISIPFKVFPHYSQIEANKLDIRIKLKSFYDTNLSAHYVLVRIPVPKGTVSITSNTLLGRVKYEPEDGAILWKIKKFQGQFECSLQCQVLLCSCLYDKNWVKPPIGLEFDIPMFSASGFKLCFLKIYEKSGYKPKKFNKILTRAGEYEHRL